MTTIALIGNPNCGKTTLFNALTGTHQRVGNWPGVTVERKTGSYRHGAASITVEDLPGTYSIETMSNAIDEQIAQRYIVERQADVVVNVIDAASLARGLYLTLELIEQDQPIVVALNMIDVADKHGYHIDADRLSQRLGCPVVPLIATREDGVGVLKDAIMTLDDASTTLPAFTDAQARYGYIDRLLTSCVIHTPVRLTVTDRVDNIVLNRYLAFPLFLLVMYLMFMFAINVGSAFIDFFDIVGSVLFVEGPRQVFTSLGMPQWLTVFLADGVGGGVQLVGTFIPVIGCLFLALSFLEDTGYMGRVAFIIDRSMRRLGLPGKSFVPLIVGFGCNVPAVMATRTLDNEPDRILTTIMAPYMSCGARLTVYALFAAAFFPSGGQNIVFGLYLIGIVVAVLSALIVKKYLVAAESSNFLLELPAYHLPTLKGLVLQTWQRLKGFVLRAGKAIVAVVIILNVVNSIGVDGSVGNENSENSVLSAIGKSITPVFHPMGIDEDNWPATVGIFAGIFAKEVVVGTLDALYAPDVGPETTDLLTMLGRAVQSVPDNLAELGDTLMDPLGLGLGELEDVSVVAAEQDIAIDTIGVMRNLFHGELGAFSYLVFILLYMPCVATIGVIYKELGSFWAIFSTSWSVMMAYSVAVLCYQVGSFDEDPAASAAWIAGALAFAGIGFTSLIWWGQRRAPANLIPVVQLK